MSQNTPTADVKDTKLGPNKAQTLLTILTSSDNGKAALKAIGGKPTVASIAWQLYSKEKKEKPYDLHAIGNQIIKQFGNN